MTVLSFKASDELVHKLDKMANKRGISRAKMALSLLNGACVVDDMELKNHADPDEMKLAKHFLNVDLLQDLQYLGPKTAELTSKELDSVVLFYRDKAGKVPHLVHQFRIGNGGEFHFTAHTLSVLGYMAAHLLPKALRDRLSKWAQRMGGKPTDIGTALTMYLSKLYVPANVPDEIGVEINQEFEDAMVEASKQEAFGRESR